MARWAPFLWLTVLVLVSLLVLARFSSAVVRDHPPRRPDRHRLGEPTRFDADPAEPDVSSSGSEPAAETVTPGETAELGDRIAEPSAQAPRIQTGDVQAGDTDTPPAGGDASLQGAERVELSTGTLLANVALTQGLVGVALVAGIVWFEIPLPDLGLAVDPWIRGLPAVGLGLAFGLVLWLGNEAAASLADAVGATYDEAVRGMLAPSSLPGWAILLGVVLPTVAVVEELLFRGALIGVAATATDLSPWLFAVVSSVAFALGHGAQGRVGIAVTGVLGLVLAVGYVVSGSLLVVVVAHYVVNAMEFVVHEGLGIERL